MNNQTNINIDENIIFNYILFFILLNISCMLCCCLVLYSRSTTINHNPIIIEDIDLEILPSNEDEADLFIL